LKTGLDHATVGVAWFARNEVMAVTLVTELMQMDPLLYVTRGIESPDGTKLVCAVL
jgi:hypothetical protein